MEGIEFAYGDDRRVLRGVSLEVPKGTVQAILGPSGCGKTTLLRVIAGLESPIAGTVRSGPDRVLTDVGSRTSVDLAHRGVAMVFQNWALFPHMTVAENVSFAMPREVRRDGSLLAETLAMVDLEGLDERRPAELSGGQQQRVALGRALAQRPEILLLDEPFSNLDPALRSQVREDVARLLSRLEVTTLLVTHDRAEAFVVGDTVALMREGEVVTEGEPAELYRNPPDRWCATFLGDAVLLEGTATSDGRVASALGVTDVVGPRDLPAGHPVTVMVRPESLTVRRTGEPQTSPEPAPGVEATVTRVRYSGPLSSYEVSIGHESVQIVRPGAPSVGVGERVVVVPPTEPVVVWERSGYE
ncbi:MAG: ABC transporter ATP-binding protein [Microthrixaceae bacterium]